MKSLRTKSTYFQYLPLPEGNNNRGRKTNKHTYTNRDHTNMAITSMKQKLVKVNTI